MPNIFTANSVRSGLIEANKDYNGRKVWEQAFQTVDYAKENAINQLDKDYNDTVTQAYLSSLSSKQGILASNLGQGYKDLALEQNQLALDNAFESYKANYLASRNEIDANAEQSNQQIEKALTEQSQKYADYANAAVEYLPWLYEQNPELFESDAALDRYLDYELDDNGNKVVKGIRDISSEIFTMDEYGRPVLNDIGKDYMDFVQNYGAVGNLPDGRKFSDFLSTSDKNQKILDWLNEADPYNYGKTNQDSFNDIVGSNGNAGPYQLTKDKFTSSSWQDIKDNYDSKHSELIDKFNEGHKSEKDASAFMKEQRAATEQLIDFAERLGILDDSEVSALVSKVKKNLDTYDDTVANPGKGNNRKNREWAASNALGDYEDLYDAVMRAYDSDGFEVTTDRKEYSTHKLGYKYEEGKVSDELYKQQLKNTVTIPDELKSPIVDEHWAGGKKFINIDYSLKGEGKEKIEFRWDDESPYTGSSEFTSLKTYTITPTYGDASKTRSGPDAEYEIGVLPGDVMAIRYDGKVYKLEYTNTKHNKAFIDALKLSK